MAHDVQLSVSLPDATSGVANRELSDLQACLERAAANAGVRDLISFNRRTDRGDTQDLGTVLEISVLGPVAVAIASGIKLFIAKAGSRVRICDREGRVLIDAVGGAADAVRIDKVIEAYQAGNL